MIAQVIPNKKMPRNIGYFDYLVPKELEAKIKIGQIVKIPFRNQKLNGIVFNTTETHYNASLQRKNVSLKNIANITEYSLPSFQLKLLKWLNQYYFSSYSGFLKLIMPEIPKRKFPTHPLKIHGKEALNIKKNELPKIKKISENILKSSRVSLLHWDSNANKNLCLIKIISEQIKKKKQTLIILPQITDIEPLTKYINQYFNEQIAFIYSGLSKTLNWHYWQKINNNEIKIIIGTRSAIFAPLKNPGLLIIENEHLSDHKQYDQNPRYDTREIAVKIKELTGCKLLFTSFSPRIQTYFQSQNNEYFLANLLNNQKPIYSTINLKSTFKNEISWFFSERIIEKIKNNISLGKKTVLFINRKGLNTSLMCSDCGFSIKCPTCDLPLDSFKDTEGTKLRCLHCNFLQDNITYCPKCNSQNIKDFGIGSQKVEREIKKIIPNAKVLRIDKDEEKKLKNTALDNYQIIIGTPFLLKNYWLDIKNLGTFVVVSFDSLFNITEYTANERVYQLIKEFQLKAIEQKADLIIQTFNPENNILNTINDYKKFYTSEIKERKIFNYPPFKILVKLIYQEKNKKKCELEAWRVYEKIKKIRLASLEIMEPYAYYKSKLRNNFRYNILIKISKEELGKLEPYIPAKWIIDVEPENLI